MQPLELRKPAAPSAIESLRETQPGPSDRPGPRWAIAVLIAGSGLFAVARTGIDPRIPQWLVPTGLHNPDASVIVFAIVSFIEWALLMAFTVVPLGAALIAVDRLWIANALTRASDRTRRWTYNGIALASLAVAFWMWPFAWERAVKPITNSLVGAIALVGLLALLGLYSLRKTRNAT